MALPDDASIEHLALRLIDRSLPKIEWTHGGHFAAALWLLRHRRDLSAPDKIRQVIMRYNDATKTPNTDTSGYHHTITLASMRAATHHLDRCGEEASLAMAHKSLMASEFADPDWLLDYWKRDTLFSAHARKEWVEPDLRPLPF